MEIWKQIPGFSNYEVSSFGKVRNKSGSILVQWLNGSREDNLYLALDLQKDGDEDWKTRRKRMSVHRLVLMAFHGMPEDGQIACHKNNIKTDNRPENLYWGTYKDNAADQIKNGTFKYAHPGLGENHHSAKFSNEIIEKIRSEYTGKRGEQTSLAKKYGMAQQNISAIVNGKLRVGRIR